MQIINSSFERVQIMKIFNITVKRDSPWFFRFFLVVAFSYGVFFQSAELPPVPVLLKQMVHDLMAYHQRRSMTDVRGKTPRHMK
jgi:hypothetical protein